MVLTTLEGEVAISEARDMISRSRRSLDENAIIEMVSTIILYKFTTLNRDEVAAMLGYKIDELKQSRVYQEAREEGREEERREIVLMLLSYKFGQLSSQNQDAVAALKLDRLQDLSTALLDFTSLADLETWLQG